MTRFDMKVVIFVNKIVKCRKSVTVRPSTCRVGKPDLWKILSGRVLLWRHLRSRRCNVAPNLNDSCVAFEQRFQPLPAPLSMEFFLPVTEKIVLLHPKIHCLMRKGFALSTSSFSIPATPPSPYRIRSKRPPREPFPYFCRHKKSSELWRIKETSCQRNSYLKQSRKTHPSTRISRKKHYKKYCISWSHSYV